MTTLLTGDDVALLGTCAATSVLDKLRAGDHLDQATLRFFDRLPWIDYLRQQARPGDERWLRGILSTPGLGAMPELRLIAVFLLGGLSESDTHEELLSQLWEHDTEDYDLRFQVAPRLLDISELSEDMHRRIYRWVSNHWDRWHSDAQRWYGGPASVLEGVRKRLEDERFPPGKAWLYLCIAAAAESREEAQALWAEYRDHPVPFIAAVARDLSEGGRPASCHSDDG
jgi:hypothetical protein